MATTPLTPAQRAWRNKRAYEMHLKGMTCVAIAQRIGVTSSRAQTIVRHYEEAHATPYHLTWIATDDGRSCETVGRARSHERALKYYGPRYGVSQQLRVREITEAELVAIHRRIREMIWEPIDDRELFAQQQVASEREEAAHGW